MSNAYGAAAGLLGLPGEIVKFMARAYDVEVSPTQVDAQSYSTQTFTVTGLLLPDMVIAIKPTRQEGLEIMDAIVSADNTLSLRFANRSIQHITPTAAETYKVIAIRIAAT